MPGILQQPKKFFDDNNLMAKDVMTEDYGFPTLHHITTETSLKELPGVEAITMITNPSIYWRMTVKMKKITMTTEKTTQSYYWIGVTTLSQH